LPTSKNTKTRTSQSEKFKELAHEAGADQDEAAFKQRLGKIVTARRFGEPTEKADKKPAKGAKRIKKTLAKRKR
jgi:hypothetical protein